MVNYGQSAIYKIEGGGGPVVHDLSVASVKAPSKVTLSASKPTVTSRLAVTVVNSGTATETIADMGALDALVSVTGTALTGDCVTAPVPALVPPKQGTPLTLAPGKKLKLGYAVTFDCASATPAAVEFEWDVAVDLSELGGTDAAPANDTCPRAAAGDDKGCGGKPLGSAIRTDVIQK